jgi:hypothetical protein
VASDAFDFRQNAISLMARNINGETFPFNPRGGLGGVGSPLRIMKKRRCWTKAARRNEPNRTGGERGNLAATVVRNDI